MHFRPSEPSHYLTLEHPILGLVNYELSPKIQQNNPNYLVFLDQPYLDHVPRPVRTRDLVCRYTRPCNSSSHRKRMLNLQSVRGKWVAIPYIAAPGILLAR